MEYGQPPLMEEPKAPFEPGAAAKDLPAPAPPGRQEGPPPANYVKRPRKRGPWHYAGLLLAGLCCYALLIGLGSYFWAKVTYSRLGYISGELLPMLIFLGAIFLASCLITALARGGAIFPALLFTLLANAASFLVAEPSLLWLSGILQKLALSLLAAVISFVITKMLILGLRRRRKMLR